MYKKVFISTILIISILVAGCSKKELSEIEVANLYLNVAIIEDVSIAKDTGYEDSISEFVFNLKNEEYKKILRYKVLQEGNVCTQQEFNRLLAVNQKLRNKTKFRVEINEEAMKKEKDKNYTHMSAYITTIDRKYFYDKFREKLKSKIKIDEKKLLNGNTKSSHVMNVAFVYYVEAYEEAAEDILNSNNFLTEETNLSILLRYNKATNKWDFLLYEQFITVLTNRTKYIRLF